MCLLSVRPIQIVVPLPIWSVFERLMKNCIPSLDQLMSRMVGWSLGSNLWSLRVNSLTLKKPKNPRVSAALSIKWSCLSCGPFFSLCSMWPSMSGVSGSRVGLRCMGPWRRWTPLMASLSIGFFEAGLLYPMEWWRKETAAT